MDFGNTDKDKKVPIPLLKKNTNLSQSKISSVFPSPLPSKVKPKFFNEVIKVETKKLFKQSLEVEE